MLQQSLAREAFTVIAVAMESRGSKAAREWIERAQPTYPCLIDRAHLVSDLYHMTNVPQAVWIDEHGRIARPCETAGASSSRDMAKRTEVREFYCEAVRDWVRHGEASRYHLDAAGLASHAPPMTEEIAQAHVCFRLGQHLWDGGDREQALPLLLRASELSPDSWNMFRQMKNLEHVAGSAGPEFMARVQEFLAAGKRYYPAPDMPGITEIYTKK